MKLIPDQPFTVIKDYYVCERCNRNSHENEWCPCPRGSCEAELVGEIIVTIELKHKNNEIKST